MLTDGENDSVVTDASCESPSPTLNASVCTGGIGRLNLSDSQRRTSSRSRSRESRTARFALLSSIGPNALDSRPSSRPLVPLCSLQLPCSAKLHRCLFAMARNSRSRGGQSTVRAGTEIQVKTERPKVTLSLAEMDQGSWVIFQLPGFANAASATQQASMDALRKANRNLASYFRSGDTLWAKLVATKAPLPIVRPTDLQAEYSGQPISATAGPGGTSAATKSRA